MGCDDFLAGMLLTGVLKILDSSDARPDLCLGIAGCWGSLYWLLRESVVPNSRQQFS